MLLIIRVYCTLSHDAILDHCAINNHVARTCCRSLRAYYPLYRPLYGCRSKV